MEGFERTSTRALVERAGTNLVAIHYHFGSKEAVYRAAADHIASAIRERSEPVLDRARRVADRPRASRQALIDAVCDVVDDFGALMLAGGLPECWRRFLTREQLEPSGTGAPAIIEAAIEPFFTVVFALVSRLIDQPPEHAEVRLLTTMIFGQVSVLRMNRKAVLRLLRWKHFGPDELREVRSIVRKYVARLLESSARAAASKPARA